MDRRQYLGLTGASIVALLGGCSSSSSQSTATATDTATATETATETSTATATETPTEEPTETATETPEPQNLSFQSIYDDAMADARAPSVSDEVLNSVDKDDWSARDLEKVAVSAAQNARKEHSAQNIAKALYQTFSTDADELYADSRGVSLGGYRRIPKVFDLKNGEFFKLVPWASQTDESDALRAEEAPNSNTERALAGLADSSDNANQCPYDTGLHPDSPEGDWSGWIKSYSDLIVGSNWGEEKVTVGPDAAEEIRRLELEEPGTEHIKFINEDYQSTELEDEEWRVYNFNEEGEGWNAETISGYSPDQGYVSAT